MALKPSNVVELPYAFELRKREVQKVAERMARELGACNFCGSNELTAGVAERLGSGEFEIEACPVVYGYGEPVVLKPVVLCFGCKKWLTN